MKTIIIFLFGIPDVSIFVKRLSFFVSLIFFGVKWDENEDLTWIIKQVFVVKS